MKEKIKHETWPEWPKKRPNINDKINPTIQQQILPVNIQTRRLGAAHCLPVSPHMLKILT